MVKTSDRNQATSSPAPSAVLEESPFTRIVEAARRVPSLPQFYHDVLVAIAQSFQSPYAALYVRLPSEVVEHDWHGGGADPAFWRATVDEFLTESLTESRARARLLTGDNAALRVGVVSVPLHDSRGASIGAIAMVARITRDDARRNVAVLESLAALTSYVSGLVGRTESTPAAAASAPPSQALAKGAAVESVEEFAYAITNGIRNKLNCEHAALGMVRGSTVRIVSISGLDDIKRRSPGVVEILAAMEECLDAGRPIVVNADSDSDVAEKKYLLHRQWHDASRGASVVSIPLVAGGSTIAILSLRRSGSDPFTPTAISQLVAVLEPYAGALMLVRNACRGVHQHLRDAVGERVRKLLQKGHWGRKVILAACVLASTWFLFGHMHYSVTARAAIVPAEMRHITMPFDGVLQSAKVIAGDSVRENDVLCTLDSRELELKRAELRAELEIAERELNAAMAESRRVDAQLAGARRELFLAKLAAAEAKLAQCVVRSPYAGVVVDGDLSRRVGAVLPQGEPLFRVAPLHALALEIEIPEHDSEEVVAEMPGRFVAEARPEVPHEFRMTRVCPSSERRQDRNIFVGRSTLTTPVEWLRPGMEGVVRIDAGRRPVWWIVLHRALDALRVNFWL